MSASQRIGIPFVLGTRTVTRKELLDFHVRGGRPWLYYCSCPPLDPAFPVGFSFHFFPALFYNISEFANFKLQNGFCFVSHSCRLSATLVRPRANVSENFVENVDVVFSSLMFIGFPVQTVLFAAGLFTLFSQVIIGTAPRKEAKVAPVDGNCVFLPVL